MTTPTDAAIDLAIAITRTATGHGRNIVARPRADMSVPHTAMSIARRLDVKSMIVESDTVIERLDNEQSVLRIALADDTPTMFIMEADHWNMSHVSELRGHMQNRKHFVLIMSAGPAPLETSSWQVVDR